MLASGAVERSPSAQNTPPNVAPTPQTRLTVSAVYIQRDLKVSGIAFTIRKIVESRATFTDSLRENRLHISGQPIPGRGGHSSDRSHGVQSGPPKGLASIDIAYAHHDPGIHQESLHRAAPVLGSLLQVMSAELTLQRLRAQMQKLAISLQIFRAAAEDETEPTGIHQAETLPGP